MPSFSIPLSGLDASSTDLSVIANNLANMNTTGYKDQEVNFQDLFYQQVGNSGDGNEEQVGVGTAVGSISSVFTEGSIESTGVSTDVAIQGNGFFVANQGGLAVYTRAGDFSVSATGQLLTENGAQVEGYQAVNGVINPNQAIGPLTIPQGQISPPQATANVQITMNLDSDTAVGGTWSTAETVYDSLGGTHVLTFNFTKTAANTWSYNITIPAADVGGTGNPVSIGQGQLTFDGNGNLLTPAADVTGLTINNLADGANPLTFNWNLYDANKNPQITQNSGSSAASAATQDGYASGTLLSYTINSDGTILGSFSNNQTTALGQIAIASFANVQGLERNGSNEYLATLSSGAANVGVPGTGGRGTLEGGSLEESNVDIATELSELILAERDYQANAKTVTTFDDVTQDAINLIQT